MDFQNTFLRDYLAMVEDTESPRIFHVWSALSGVGACLGRKSFLPFAVGDIYPNMYVTLVGPPGVKKSTAIKIMQRYLTEMTDVRFAPDDTAGQRQGLIVAMENRKPEDEEKIEGLIDSSAELTLDNINGVRYDMNEVNKHVMYVCASEFNSFLSGNVKDMLPFLNKMWDVEPYRYKTKTGELVLDKSLLNILAGTTSANIASALPPEVIGQGFMSRLILVYGAEPYKKIARPKRFDPALEQIVRTVYADLWHKYSGPFLESKEAADKFDALYYTGIKINDPRFMDYSQRRFTHLQKLSMCLAASRLSHTIEIDDIAEAEIILTATEILMPQALGEFGMNRMGAAKQKMLEYMQQSNRAVAMSELHAIMSRDMTPLEFNTSIQDLVRAKKLLHVSTESGPAFIYVEGVSNPVDDALKDLIDQRDEEMEVRKALLAKKITTH